MTTLTRRALLAGTGASLLLPSPWAWVWANSEGALQLLKVPKLALVIGNASYKHVPALRNPANDARAMGAVLMECGFDVSVTVDATRAEMLEAFDAYQRRLAARRAVGVLYFAGHGVQVDWRNYLLPVDVEVAKVEEVPAHCVDVNELMVALRKSSNPMNVVILDACRDNPFGAGLRPPQAGLSQMDAPPATLLAYATAPGNGASDGQGENGLYTGNLVREMRVNGARIEDVFKRVRLNVRRESKGAQIPWESTSLEEDFFFRPPAQPVAESGAAANREFEAELATWESIKASNDARPLEDFLRRYPSGRFSELAQLRLDTVLARQGEKRVEVAPSTGNPNTAGSARADTRFRIGDSYSFRVLDLDTGIETGRRVSTVTAVTETEVVFDDGEVVTDLLGNILKDRDGRRSTGQQIFGVDYSVGKRWKTRANVILPSSGARGVLELELRVEARESVTVPAGTFDCFKVTGRGYTIAEGGINTLVKITRWIAPDRCRRAVALETTRITSAGRVVTAVREELVAFHQA